MAISYKKLWHILVDRDMKKKDLQVAAHLTHYQMTKLGHGDNVKTNVIGNICDALGCKSDEIIDFVPDKK